MLTTYKTNPTSDTAAVYRYMKGLRELGWEAVTYFDGEEMMPLDKMKDWGDQDIACAVTAVDECRIYLKNKNTDQRASMLFVMGNDPDEVCADSTYADGWNEDIQRVEEAIFPESR